MKQQSFVYNFFCFYSRFLLFRNKRNISQTFVVLFYKNSKINPEIPFLKIVFSVDY